MNGLASDTPFDEQKEKPDHAANRDDAVKRNDAAKCDEAGGIAHTQNAEF